MEQIDEMLDLVTIARHCCQLLTPIVTQLYYYRSHFCQIFFETMQIFLSNQMNIWPQHWNTGGTCRVIQQLHFNIPNIFYGVS